MILRPYTEPGLIHVDSFSCKNLTRRCHCDLKITKVGIYTVLIVHRIVLFWEPDRCFQDGGQKNRREVGTYFITISSVY